MLRPHAGHAAKQLHMTQHASKLIYALPNQSICLSLIELAQATEKLHPYSIAAEAQIRAPHFTIPKSPASVAPPPYHELI